MREAVEFVDLEPATAAGGGLAPATGPPATPGPAPDAVPRRGRALLVALLLLAGAVTAARVLGAPDPPPAAAAAAGPAPVFGGHVTLPADFGAPVALVTGTVPGRDDVWALGTGGRVARLTDGVVAAVTDGRGYGTVAVRPDGGAVFASTGRLAPTVVALDPLTLQPRAIVSTAAPVTALAAGGGSVWAASAAGLEAWTSDLARPLRVRPQPTGVAQVTSLAVVGSVLQGVATTAAGGSALLLLDVAAGGVRLSPPFDGPVSLAPGRVPLLAHERGDGTVTVTADPGGPTPTALDRPLAPGTVIWSTAGLGTARWASSGPGCATLDCFDAASQLVGRMSVGDGGAGVRGPVATTTRAVYAVTVDGRLARGNLGSCGAGRRVSAVAGRGD